MAGEEPGDRERVGMSRDDDGEVSNCKVSNERDEPQLKLQRKQRAIVPQARMS